jgi:hypothetical protein
LYSDRLWWMTTSGGGTWQDDSLWNNIGSFCSSAFVGAVAENRGALSRGFALHNEIHNLCFYLILLRLSNQEWTGREAWAVAMKTASSFMNFDLNCMTLLVLRLTIIFCCGLWRNSFLHIPPVVRLSFMGACKYRDIADYGKNFYHCNRQS